MPEYDQKDLTPLRQIRVSFASQEDLDAFARLVGQKIGPKTKSIWYPAAEIGHYAHLRYVSEVEE